MNRHETSGDMRHETWGQAPALKGVPAPVEVMDAQNDNSRKGDPKDHRTRYIAFSHHRLALARQRAPGSVRLSFVETRSYHLTLYKGQAWSSTATAVNLARSIDRKRYGIQKETMDKGRNCKQEFL